MSTTESATSAHTETEDGTDRRILQRMILPLHATPDIVPLYIEQSASRSTPTLLGAGDARGTLPGTQSTEATDQQEGAPNQATPQVEYSELSGRHSAVVPATGVRSFGTYFNAFPAGYWRRWTPVRSVRLHLRVEGTGQIVIYRSNARGAAQRHDHHTVTGSEDLEFDLPLKAFGDGGWYWFDAYAGSDDLRVVSAHWSADASVAREKGTVSLAMTTMNKVSYCLDNIREVATNDDLRELLDVMYVVDQGSDRLSDHPEELDPLVEAMGDQLQIIEQGNLGGSGGFARGMYEGAEAGTSAYVVNCDDDIVIEPEALIRMVTFADYATKPTMVGAHMFDLNNRSVLYSFGEAVNLWSSMWGPANQHAVYGHDFAHGSLRTTPWLHRRVDVDYNGWWMCLIPVEVIRKIGLSLPVFIKWDDAEYGLRAKEAGFPTVSLPGAGVWHISWADKDDAVDWQSYFHERNRLITALLHSPYEHSGRAVKDSQAIDVKHLISMQYATLTGRLLAQQDILRGPQELHPELGTKLKEVRALAKTSPDGVTAPDVEEFPPVKVEKPLFKSRLPEPPRRSMLPLWAAKNLAKQAMRPVKALSQQHPQDAIPHEDARWWRLAGYDSALVSNADGSKVAWYHRDPVRFRQLLAGTLRTHTDLTRRWPRLRRQYRAALADITSFDSWKRTFEANPAPERDTETSSTGGEASAAKASKGSAAQGSKDSPTQDDKDAAAQTDS